MDFLRILFSSVYIKTHRTTRTRADAVGRAHPGTFLGFHGTGSVILYETSARRLRFSHHAVIDELHSDKSPQDRCPSAKILHNQDFEQGVSHSLIRADVEALEITNDRWTLQGVKTIHIMELTSEGTLGINVRQDDAVGRVYIHSVNPDSPCVVPFQGFNPIGRFVLNINGVDIYTIDSLRHALMGIHSCPPNSVSGITLLLGKLPDDAHRSCMPHHAFAVTNVNKLTEVWSIDTNKKEPLHAQPEFQQVDFSKDKAPSWKKAMKGPYRKWWLHALDQFMQKCRPYSTFSLPIVPPANATVLDLVVVLKYALDEFQRLNEFKLRLCAHGGQQTQGKDYDFSFAPAPVSASLRFMIATYAWLCGEYKDLTLKHIDIKNAFQSTPDRRERIFVRCFPEMWDWFQRTYLS